MNDKAWHHIGDAVLISVLLVATVSGAPLWLVFSGYLVLALITSLFKAFNVWARPIVAALKDYKMHVV